MDELRDKGAGLYGSNARSVPSLLDTLSLVMWILVVSSLFSLSAATTEWWGDLRAHLNPSRQPAFYDVTYDETGGSLLQIRVPKDKILAFLIHMI